MIHGTGKTKNKQLSAKHSLEGKVLAFVVALAALNVIITSLIFHFFPNLALASVVSLLTCTVISLLVVRWFFHSINHIIQALIDGLQGFKDRDFSVSIAVDRNDDFGDLIKAHNEVKEILRKDRIELSQKELLLETVNQTTPIAMFLVNNNDRVTYSNASARKLLNAGKSLEGLNFLGLVDEKMPSLKDAFRQKADGLYSYEREGEVETYHISWRNFKLHGQRHDLYLVKEMTRELNRQEVATWKKVIRVISHELNNSLTPISSLAHSGQILLNKNQQQSQEKIQRVLITIEERANYLKTFIEGYARFAKLPKPQIQPVPVMDFVKNIEQTTGVNDISLPATSHLRFDPVQIQQVIINLIKNAVESGSELEEVTLCLQTRRNDLIISVTDKGKGMSEEELHNALVPFYSTKAGGSGLGLALCREIVEAHGGGIQLNNRADGGLQVLLTLPGQTSSR